MRWGVGIVATILVSGCATSSSPASDEPVCYEARIDELLKTRPDDPDLLFLRHDHMDLARCSRLADLRPTPVVLASVVSRYLSAGLERVNLPSFERHIATLLERDPDNAMPLILQSQIQISRGNLSGGIETIVRASRLPALRVYSLEAQQEALRIRKKEGLDDVVNLGEVTGRGNYRICCVLGNAALLLRTMGTWSLLQGDRGEAIRLAEADDRLAGLMNPDAMALSDGMMLNALPPLAAERLCELALMNGDSEGASRYAVRARAAWIVRETRTFAILRDVESDPGVKLMRKLTVWDSMNEVQDSEDAGEILTAFVRDIVTSANAWKKQKPVFDDMMRKNEAVIRPRLEAQIARGAIPVALEGLSEEDRRSLDSRKAPVDYLMELRDVFYPRVYGPEHRERLVALLTPEGAFEDPRRYLHEKAANALAHHVDRAALPALRRRVHKDYRDYDVTRVAAVMVALGEKDDRVIKDLRVRLSPRFPEACWAAARLRLVDCIPDLVKSVWVYQRPKFMNQGFAEPVTAYLALQSLTGQPFGFDGRRWREWARKEGYLKSDD